MKKTIIFAVLLVACLGVATLAYRYHQQQTWQGIASGNGRIEANQVDIASKYAGRISQVSVKEGDWVKKGQVLATLDAESIEAELGEANADLTQNQANEAYAKAIVKQKDSEFQLAKKELSRIAKLAADNHASQEMLDKYQTQVDTAAVALEAANIQVTQAQAGIQAALARIKKLNIMLTDTKLVAPITGRIVYKLVEPGEVIAAGAKIITLLDTQSVYMSIYLSTLEAGRTRVNSDARIVLDVIPNLPLPAYVSFVDPQSQFTPKEVETKSEREKLMFKVKVHINEKLLAQYADIVKTGLPGVAYVKIDPTADWPAELELIDPK